MEDTEQKYGVLYLIATPIGNLEDITFRAVRLLKEADLICAEDTRTSAKLLTHYDIHTPTTSYHEHNKLGKLPVLLEKLKTGQTLAVITDAGTPGISDPGEELVAACVEEGIPVYAVPGAVAAACAVTTSGLSSRRFAFEAFLPKKKKKRQQVLEELKNETRTMIIYEAPHHLLATLRELHGTLGDRRVVLCRELTKRYEEKEMMLLSEAVRQCEANEPRGEYVVVIEGKTFLEVVNEKYDQWKDISIAEHFQRYMDEGMDRKEAMKRVAADRGIRKRDVYDAVCR
ncbi:MAG: 16S rRNA (cytidine(1402)-2'-O)-methyltransferase [Lachnospiraceae bacterium]|nr:16S rRNA (cytidine(1402)-2'-O)-methyltransferase [Lachnospiraceae bacterium]